MRTRASIEFPGIWEIIHNPDFNRIEFDTVRNEAGGNAFVLTPFRVRIPLHDIWEFKCGLSCRMAQRPAIPDYSQGRERSIPALLGAPAGDMRFDVEFTLALGYCVLGCFVVIQHPYRAFNYSGSQFFRLFNGDQFPES